LPTLTQGEPDAKSLTIANHILDLLSPGDTLQLSLGKIPAAVLLQIAQNGLRRLGYHAGMISPEILAALDANVFSRGETTGVALGDQNFYEEVSSRENIHFASVGMTHSLSTLTQMSRFVSINSVIEVDLLGQANCEHISGKQISGQGGLVDFIRGSRVSDGRRAIFVLPPTTSNGCVSRIVLSLEASGPVSVARSDTYMIVTEYGIADLREANMDQRAERLIVIAAPQFRNLLANAWHNARCQTVGYK
jgi:acyl-CoA hydrolase